MNASSQSQPGGARQPKTLNSPKASPDDTTTGSSSPCGPLSLRARKRDRADMATPILAIKRDPDPFARAIEEEEASSGTGCADAVQEILKITEMGGLKNTELVEKMLKLMQADRTEKKIDLTGRVMLAGIIAGTDTANNDCLVKFVQMRGVAILDEWLQEAHKGTKQGEYSNGKAVEELLLALLRALEKLPINLNALRTCHIGKSVNHLRGHKNLEVQKKARFLVDVWKRRVDEEMKAHELKGGSACQTHAQAQAQAASQTQFPMSKPALASKSIVSGSPKLQVSVDSQNKLSEAEQSPNSSSSFGSSAAPRHPRRAINGQLQHRTSTGPITRSSDMPVVVPDNSIGQRIVARMSNVGRNVVTEGLLTNASKASSPVKTHHFQGTKSKNVVKEEDKDMGGPDDGQNEETGEKCVETIVRFEPSGDDLGMLASVATEEISKAEPSSAVKEETCASSCDNENSIGNEKNERGGNKCESVGVYDNVQLGGESKNDDFQSDKEEGKVISDKVEGSSVKFETIDDGREELATIPTKSVPGQVPDKPAGTLADKMESWVQKPISADLAEAGSTTSTGSTVVPDTSTRVEFDLNEGILPLEDGPHTDTDPGTASTLASSLSLPNPPFAPRVTIAAPAKGPFNPPENLLRSFRGSETGWRGSGPTSAFRPAEPRKVLEISVGVGSLSGSDLSVRPANRPLLEIDLNVPDERVLEDDMGTSQKPDDFGLDLNRTDVGPSGFRDFDLNGPGWAPDESSTENYSSRNQLGRVGPTGGSIQLLSHAPGLRMTNNSETGQQLWLPSSAPYPCSVQGSFPVAAQRMVGPFGTADICRGPVGAPGMHAVPYLGQVQFPFGFSPGTAGPYQSMVMPTNIGVGLVQGQRPFIVVPSEGSSSMSVGSGKWGPGGRPVAGAGLDLNAGPMMGAGGELHGVLHVGPVLGGKRAEPEGGWDHLDRERSSFGSNKQLSWQ